MERARRVIFSVTGGPSMTLQHVDQVARTVAMFCDEEANIIFGTTVDEDLDEELCVTVVATDFPGSGQR